MGAEQIAGTVAVSASAIVTAAMAVYTRKLAGDTKEVARATQAEAEAVVTQGEAIARQAEASAAQAASVAEQARASVEQLELTRMSLTATTLPWLALRPAAEHDLENASVAGSRFMGAVPRLVVNETSGELSASVCLKNVGAGLAVIHATSSHLLGWRHPRAINPDEMQEFNHATLDDPVVPPGGLVRVNYEVEAARWETSVDAILHRTAGLVGNFALDVVYSDMADQQRARLRLLVSAAHPRDTWGVYELHYFRPHDAMAPAVMVRVS